MTARLALFARGAHVIWRSRPGGGIGYVAPHVVVEDGNVIALFQPAGTICKKRGGRRGGPRARNMVEWDGTHTDVVFAGPSNVKLYEPGTASAVYRRWDAESDQFVGWYVNLEGPWVRRSLSFDSWDHVLDIEVADDLSWWRWKDEDELEWSVEHGKVTRVQYEAIHAEGERVAESIETRAWPFDVDWLRWRPDPNWPTPLVSDGWDRFEQDEFRC